MPIHVLSLIVFLGYLLHGHGARIGPSFSESMEKDPIVIFNMRIASLLIMFSLVVSAGDSFAQDARVLPAGTRAYIALDQSVSSERGESDVGMTVACRIWRDVENDGIVFIRAGTPASCRVERVKRNNIGGVGGKISIGGFEVRAADGQRVFLQGGYNKEGGEKAQQSQSRLSSSGGRFCFGKEIPQSLLQGPCSMLLR